MALKMQATKGVAGRRRISLLPRFGAPGPPYREEFMENLQILHGRFGPKCQNSGSSRCHGWIGEAQLPLVDLPRAPTDVWDPFLEKLEILHAVFEP